MARAAARAQRRLRHIDSTASVFCVEQAGFSDENAPDDRIVAVRLPAGAVLGDPAAQLREMVVPLASPNRSQALKIRSAAKPLYRPPPTMRLWR